VNLIADAGAKDLQGGRVQRGTDTGLTGSANRGRPRTGAPVLRVVYTRTPVVHQDTGRRLQPTGPGNNRSLDQGS